MLEDPPPSCDIEGVRGSLIRFQQGGSKMPLVGKGVSAKMRSQRDMMSTDHLLPHDLTPGVEAVQAREPRAPGA
jgi:hypothetical protein